MTDWQTRVRPGQPLRVSAAAYNAFVDAANAARRRRAEGGNGKAPLPGGFVEVLNTSTAAIAPFTPRVVIDELNAVVGDRDLHTRPRLFTGYPYQNYPLRMQAIAVSQEQVDNLAVGLFCVSGVTWCRVDQTQQTFLVPGVRMGLRAGAGNATGDVLRIDSLGPAMLLSTPHDTGQTDPDGEEIWIAVVSLGIRDDSFWARILGSSLVTPGTPIWEYQWEEVVISEQATPTSQYPWSLSTDGLLMRSSTSWGLALNTLEAGNSPGQAYGIAVGGGFAIGNTNYTFRPVPEGAIVKMRYSSRWGGLDVSAGGHHEMLFSAPNPVAGTCQNLQFAEGYYYGDFEDLEEISGIQTPTGSQA